MFKNATIAERDSILLNRAVARAGCFIGASRAGKKEYDERPDDTGERIRTHTVLSILYDSPFHMRVATPSGLVFYTQILF